MFLVFVGLCPGLQVGDQVGTAIAAWPVGFVPEPHWPPVALGWLPDFCSSSFKGMIIVALSVLHVQDRINSACVTSTSCLSKLSLKRWWQCEKITGPPVSVSPYHSFFFSFFFVLMWILLISCYFYFNSLTYRTSYYLPLPNMFLCTWRLFFHF